MNPLLELMYRFAVLSLLAFGGASTVVPEMHRLAVVTHHWMSEETFTHLVAISQATPGPNSLIATLIGWQVAGLAGAIVATAAMSGPPALLMFGAANLWERMKSSPWRGIVQQGIAPLSVGLVLASGCIISRGADHTPGAWLLTAATVAALLSTRLHPLWLIAAGALLGLAGVV
ncbi:chromate transporter [Geomonas sp. Red276]